jgi:hypothetical protein
VLAVAIPIAGADETMATHLGCEGLIVVSG